MSKPSIRGEEAKMNRAEEDVHRAAKHETRPGGDRGKGSDVGNERRANMEAFDEGPASILRTATKELHDQHPIEYHEHGPHHGTDHHIRHQPLHGLKPSR